MSTDKDPVLRVVPEAGGQQYHHRATGCAEHPMIRRAHCPACQGVADPGRTVREQLTVAVQAAADTHGEHRQVDDGTANLVCGCGLFTAVYDRDEEPGARGRAMALHLAQETVDAVLTVLGAPEAPTSDGVSELTDDEWWAGLVHSAPEMRAERIAATRQRIREAASCFIGNHEQRIADLERNIRERDERDEAIRARNLRAIQREYEILQRHGMTACDCEPSEGCNAP